MKSESEIQQLIQMEAPKYNCVLMRNNSGGFKDATGRLVRFGLGQSSDKIGYKSSDLIGWTEVIITKEMVGTKIAVFTAIEVKAPNWKPKNDEREHAQTNFINWVRAKGGLAAMVNSVDGFLKLLRQ